MGKTNLLDAVHYVCTGKSYFNRSDLNSISFEEEFSFIKTELQNEEDVVELNISISKKTKKQLLRNGVRIPKLSDHYGYLPVVFLTPAEINLVNDASKLRRRFVDRILGQVDENYLLAIVRYNKLLESRNELLKMMLERGAFDPLALEAYDKDLIPLMDQIFKVRSNFVEAFGPLVTEAYKLMAGENELVEIEYESDLISKEAIKLIEANKSKDRFAGRTTAGIHKDDLNFSLNQMSLKNFGSQGQINSFVIAVHLAAYQFIKDKTGKRPVLLLDDIFEKIDSERADRLLREIGKKGYGQIFITDTDEIRIKSHINDIRADKKFFKFEATK